MTERDAQSRLHDVERLAQKAREEGRDLSAWAVIQICEGRIRLPERVPPLPHDLPRPEDANAG